MGEFPSPEGRFSQRERERAEKRLNRIESVRGHKGIQPVRKLLMSGGQIEVLNGGQSLQLPEQRANKETKIAEDSLITGIESDWIIPLIILDRCGCVLVTDLINENNDVLNQ